MGGVLKSWAVPKGPSLNPQDKRLAVAVPDHAVSYINFEGTIAEGNYGAGAVRVWDRGTYETLTTEDGLAQLEKGKLAFRLQGTRLRGEFVLLKMQRGDKQWLLIKSRDEFATQDWKLETILGIDDVSLTAKRRQARAPAKKSGKREGDRKRRK